MLKIINLLIIMLLTRFLGSELCALNNLKLSFVHLILWKLRKRNYFLNCFLKQTTNLEDFLILRIKFILEA